MLFAHVMDTVITAASWNWCKLHTYEMLRRSLIKFLDDFQAIKFVDTTDVSALKVAVYETIICPPFPVVMINDILFEAK